MMFSLSLLHLKKLWTMIQPLEETCISWGILPNASADNKVYYLDNGKSKKLTKFIQAHLDEITKYFQHHGLIFIYVDELLAFKSSEQIKQAIRERFGLDVGDEGFSNIFKACDMQIQELKVLSSQSKQLPNFLSSTTDKAFKVSLDDPGFYWDMFRDLADAYGKKDDEAANSYTDQEKEIVNEMVDQAAKNNVSIELVQAILKKLMNSLNISHIIIPNQQPLSSLRLKEQEKDIKLSPIEMALYLLLLDNPEGILETDLRNHKNELISWYKLTKQSGDDDPIDVTIDNLINQSNITISRINKKIKDLMKKKKALYKPYIINKDQIDNSFLLYIDFPEDMVIWGTDYSHRYL